MKSLPFGNATPIYTVWVTNVFNENQITAVTFNSLQINDPFVAPLSVNPDGLNYVSLRVLLAEATGHSTDIDGKTMQTPLPLMMMLATDGGGHNSGQFWH